jgi:methylmalonyl-CoA/ethylmalonyl-CoA epimerase
MKTSHIEHIGIAVCNLKESIRFYEDVMGLECYKTEDIPDQKLRTAFFMAGETKIELLESSDPDGPVAKFIEKRGEGIHHIAFAVRDIESSLKEAESKGVKLIDKFPRKGADGLKIAFVHPKSTFGVLIELCDEK